MVACAWLSSGALEVLRLRLRLRLRGSLKCFNHGARVRFGVSAILFSQDKFSGLSDFARSKIRKNPGGTEAPVLLSNLLLPRRSLYRNSLVKATRSIEEAALLAAFIMASFIRLAIEPERAFLEPGV